MPCAASVGRPFGSAAAVRWLSSTSPSGAPRSWGVGASARNEAQFWSAYSRKTLGHFTNDMASTSLGGVRIARSPKNCPAPGSAARRRPASGKKPATKSFSVLPGSGDAGRQVHEVVSARAQGDAALADLKQE